LQDIIAMEKRLLAAVNWDVHLPTACSFLSTLMRAAAVPAAAASSYCQQLSTYYTCSSMTQYASELLLLLDPVQLAGLTYKQQAAAVVCGSYTMMGLSMDSSRLELFAGHSMAEMQEWGKVVMQLIEMCNSSCLFAESVKRRHCRGVLGGHAVARQA
jgi:hypothetical protein